MTIRKAPGSASTVIRRLPDPNGANRGTLINDKVGITIREFGRKRRIVKLTAEICSIVAATTMGLFNWQVISESVASASMLLAAGVLVIVNLRVSAVMRWAVAVLSQGNDKRVFGSLCDVLATPGYRECRKGSQLETGLLRLLPLLTNEDCEQLTERQRSALMRSLSGSNCNLTRAVLISIPACNFVEALPLVEMLAEGRYAAKNDTVIREIAVGLLPIIRDCRELKRSDKTLLRAGDARPEISATALRPSEQDTAPIEKEQLLRAQLPQ